MIIRVTVSALMAAFSFADISQGQVPASKFIAVGEATRHSVERHQQWTKATKDELQTLLGQLTKATAKIDGKTLRGPIEVVQALKVYVASLRGNVGRLEAASKNHAEAMSSYAEELKKLPKILRLAGEDFVRQAPQEDENFRGLYQKTAEIYFLLAEHYERRSLTLSIDIRSFDKQMKNIKAASRYLGRLDETLQVVPDLPAGASTEQLFVDQKDFVRAFEQLREALNDLHRALGAKQVPTKTKKRTLPNSPVARDQKNERRRA